MEGQRVRSPGTLFQLHLGVVDKSPWRSHGCKDYLPVGPKALVINVACYGSPTVLDSHSTSKPNSAGCKLCMAAYISSILRGEVELLLVKQWIIGGSDLPPAPFSVLSPRSPSSAGEWPNITAEQFRVVLLNYVKEEADAIFLSSERHAADLHAKGQVAKEQSTQDPRSWHGDSNPLTAPGTVNDNSFPALSFQSTKVSLS